MIFYALLSNLYQLITSNKKQRAEVRQKLVKKMQCLLSVYLILVLLQWIYQVKKHIQQNKEACDAQEDLQRSLDTALQILKTLLEDKSLQALESEAMNPDLVNLLHQEFESEQVLSKELREHLNALRKVLLDKCELESLKIDDWSHKEGMELLQNFDVNSLEHKFMKRWCLIMAYVPHVKLLIQTTQLGLSCAEERDSKNSAEDLKKSKSIFWNRVKNFVKPASLNAECNSFRLFMAICIHTRTLIPDFLAQELIAPVDFYMQNCQKPGFNDFFINDQSQRQIYTNMKAEYASLLQKGQTKALAGWAKKLLTLIWSRYYYQNMAQPQGMTLQNNDLSVEQRCYDLIKAAGWGHLDQPTVLNNLIFFMTKDKLQQISDLSGRITRLQNMLSGLNKSASETARCNLQKLKTQYQQISVPLWSKQSATPLIESLWTRLRHCHTLSSEGSDRLSGLTGLNESACQAFIESLLNRYTVDNSERGVMATIAVIAQDQKEKLISDVQHHLLRYCFSQIPVVGSLISPGLVRGVREIWNAYTIQQNGVVKTLYQTSSQNEDSFSDIHRLMCQRVLYSTFILSRINIQFGLMPNISPIALSLPIPMQDQVILEKLRALQEGYEWYASWRDWIQDKEACIRVCVQNIIAETKLTPEKVKLLARTTSPKALVFRFPSCDQQRSADGWQIVSPAHQQSQLNENPPLLRSC